MQNQFRSQKSCNSSWLVTKFICSELLGAFWTYCWSFSLIALTIWGAGQFFQKRNFQYAQTMLWAEVTAKPDAIELQAVATYAAAYERCLEKQRKLAALQLKRVTQKVKNR